jgi:hypothetical protein
MLNGSQLRRLFHEFNQKYFDNKVPAYAIHVVPRIQSNDSMEVYDICRKKRRLIEILKGLADERTIGILLHEMAHAVTSDGHGPKWAREMVRLREAGAPLTAFDRAIHLENWEIRRVTRRVFRAHVADILCDDSVKLNLSIAIRDFILNYGSGGARTVAEFKKKFPWAGAVFKEVKRESAEYRNAPLE